jgi:hypothetical protein
MRSLIIVGSILLCVPTLARERHSRPGHLKTDLALAVVDDEPTSPEATRRITHPPDALESGARREIEIAAPSVTVVSSGGAVVDKGAPKADPEPARADAVSGVNIDELAQKQMRRYQRDLDGCLAPLRRHSPASTGAVGLIITVQSHKVGKLAMAEDSVGDLQFTSCLATHARAWSFSLPDSTFNYSLSIAPQASR